jgi:predicted DNA-binding protein
MESQLTIRLPMALSEDLTRACRILQRTRSDLVRIAVREYLDSVLPAAAAPRPIDRVRDLLGTYESGVPDLGGRHREHLLRKLRGEDEA